MNKERTTRRAGYLPRHRRDGRATYRLWRVITDVRCVFIFVSISYLNTGKYIRKA